jgi:hypothetical protein
MSKTPHKRKADDEDDVAAEGQRRAHSSSEIHPPATASSLSSAAASDPHAQSHMAVAASYSTATAADGQAPPMAAASFNRMADVEVQLIMQHLGRRSLLRFARCSRTLLRCASHLLAWRWLPFPVHVCDMDASVESRRAHSLLRFAPSGAFIEPDESESDETESESSASAVSCATLLRVPQMVSLEFFTGRRIMQLDEWRLFLHQPSAQRLTRVDIGLQPSLCDATSVSLLSQLPLLRTLGLCASVLCTSDHKSLVNAPSLTEFVFWGSESSRQPVPLEPLVQYTRLRSLSLREVPLRLGELSGMLRQFAQAGGQLQELLLSNLQMFPMTDSVVQSASAQPLETVSLELSLAAPSLMHLHTLTLISNSTALDCVPWLPSLRLLNLSFRYFPSASSIELLLRRLPHLRCVFKAPSALNSSEWQYAQSHLFDLLALAQSPHFDFKDEDESDSEEDEAPGEEDEDEAASSE